MRASLQREVRAVVKKYGPQLGPLYFDDEVQWDLFIKKNMTHEELLALTAQVSTGRSDKARIESHGSDDTTSRKHL